ncbi:DUF5753 domain-containing protein [Streptomyces anulatus]|uniref:DUF5753 domain-containing protein n=1 Tax=Streptomyces anulatus TaxID=1892 RepID=UPI0035DB09B4
MTDDVFRALRARDQRNMGRMAGGMGTEATDRLAELDSLAQTIRAWSPHLVPGLLQTDTYAAGAIKTMTPSLSGYELTARVKRRAVRRAQFLTDWRGPRTPRTGLAYFLVGEAAVVHPTLSAHGHAAQLRRLAEIIDKFPRIVVQVLRDGVPTPGHAGPFSLHGLADGTRMGHLESLVGGWYTTEPEDIARMYSAFSDMSSQALTPAETREFIAEEINTCWGSTTESSSASPATQTPTTVSS